MPAGLSAIDYLVLGIFLASTIGLGLWAGRRQKTSDEFLFADRTLFWGPLGFSLALAGLVVVFYNAAIAEGYFLGLKLLLVPLMIWAALPIVVWLSIPLYGSLRLDSVYEYLELRFDPATRAVAATTYLVWQLLWLGGILVLPATVLGLGERLSLPVLLVVVGIGATASLYTFLGGMKAGVWTDVLQCAVMAVGALVLLGAVAANLDGGLARIAAVAERLGHARVVDTAFDWSATWSIWSAAPFLALASIFFFVADQTTLQRFFSAGDDRDMKLSFLLGCGLASMLTATAAYAGLGLLAVYHDHAQTEIPPGWVVHSAIDPQTGRPLIGPDTRIDRETLDLLIGRRAILDPNTGQPYTDTSELLDARGEIRLDRLARRSTTGERQLTAGRGALVGRFVGRHLHWGLAGLLAAAVLAAAMAAVDSALSGMTAVVTIDFHRRFGWAENWLARTRGKTPEKLDQTDEYRLARPLVLVFGSAAIAAGLLIAELADPLRYLLATLGLFAGPLLGVFLLGMFTRRATGPAVQAGLLLGMLAAAWAMAGHAWPLSAIWPFPAALGAFWPLTFGLATTLLVGYLASFVAGRRKTRRELSGLVAGVGRLGVLLDVDNSPPPEFPAPPESPWS